MKKRRRSVDPASSRSSQPTERFAHSLRTEEDTSRWEPLPVHLRRVAERTRQLASVFGAGVIGFVIGLMHDIGKYAVEYQAYIHGLTTTRPDHSTAGAREAVARYGDCGKVLAFVIAAHHAGLMNGADQRGRRRTLRERLDEKGYVVPDYQAWREMEPELSGLDDMDPAQPLFGSPDDPGFEASFFIRMLFSCLVDADSIETERYEAEAKGKPAPARGGQLTALHRDRVREHMAQFRKRTRVNQVRAEVLAHAVEKADLDPGFFTFAVPTGGGKTLASLRFATEHAVKHGLRRIIYVIPFTSVIEQTAESFRDALNLPDAVLEHHGSFDWDERQARAARVVEDGDGDAAATAALRRATENWDAPIIVTTAVQFFESLYAAGRGRCRKLHNLAKSVIVLDEAQTVPLRLLRPCMAVLDELKRNYGASIVLCTATQPSLRKQDGALLKGPEQSDSPGFDIPESRELAPRPRRLYDELRRVRVEWRQQPVSDAEIAAAFAERSQMLCIVNTRPHALALFDRILHLPGARCLTTLMCARHRRDVLAAICEDLKNNRPVRLVATSLIEAGVDVDFPEVWRAATGLDAIAQAAGRCNREGLRRELGRLVIFESLEHRLPLPVKALWQAATHVLRSEADPLGYEAMGRYFRELYRTLGYEAMDEAHLGADVYRILPDIAETAETLDFPFETIAEAFRLIETTTVPILIPRNEATAAIEQARRAKRPSVDILRQLQQHAVPIRPAMREELLRSGAAHQLNPDVYGDRLVCLSGLSRYSEAAGLRIDKQAWRDDELDVP